MKNIMASGNLFGEHTTLKQISKPTAKKLFAEGEEICLQSSNMAPFNPWQSACPIKLDEEAVKSAKEHYEWCLEHGYDFPVHTPDANGQFEEVVNNFTYYDCDNERGRYVHFYKQIK